ncbi:porin [Mesosutterella sp. AGMB02718]|uniref:Porin n=1 Tax=Mesosutterella faecium TaxID=2925194 RepID=A0ABT7IP89_9BURK|nr:porin [Mesosutterella sp. AGMB02718]MDL2060208.1 porin [Mesosutterella sp. AGMB02718]
MQKKSLVALGILSALSMGASAAQVQLYGIIDNSLVFESVNAKDGAGRTNTLYMSSGEELGSRWGLRGFEDLGNGNRVGFDLQSGIRTDDGTYQRGRAFAREASIYWKSNYGKLSLGRMDAIIGTRTSAGKIAFLSAWGDGYGPYNPSLANVISEADYVDNAIFYESPSFSNFTLRLQYSMKMDSTATGTENKANSNRYAGATLTYDSGKLKGVIGYDRTFYGHTAGEDPDDGYTVTAGGMYDFGFMDLHLGLQYFDEVKASTIRGLSSWADVPAKVKGWGATLSAGFPVWGGKFIAALSYLDGENADSVKADTDVKRMVGGVGYQYPFSQRTHMYGILAAGRDEVKVSGDKVKPDYYKAVIGIRHSF